MGKTLVFLSIAFLLPSTGLGLYTHRHGSGRARWVCGTASGLLGMEFYVTEGNMEGTEAT